MQTLVEYINERFLISNDYKDCMDPSFLNLKSNGWKKLTFDDIPKEYLDVDDIDKKKKMIFKKNGEPYLKYAWWIVMCICGPMTRKEILKHFGLPGGSYATMWSNLSYYHIIEYDSKLRKSVPQPMSEWHMK